MPRLVIELDSLAGHLFALPISAFLLFRFLTDAFDPTSRSGGQ
jgi:hypothetical protein